MIDIKVLVARSPGRVTVETEHYDENSLPDDQILVRSDFSAISVGTECAWISGNSNNEGQCFPYYPGYSMAGHVVKTGRAVTNFAVGDRVVVPWGGHRSYTVAPAAPVWTGAHRIFDDRVSQKEAALIHIATFPMLGVRRLMIQMGESAMVAGLGLLGQIAVQAARLSGAVPLLVSDISPERRAMALKLGADAAFDPLAPDYVEQVRAASGKGVNATIEVTGQAIALKQALHFAAMQGRVSLLGCTRVPDCPIDFYRDVHCNGITLLGSHTGNRPPQDSRPGMWSEHDDYDVIIKYLATGRFNFAPLISTVISPDEGPDMYDRLLQKKAQPLGIVFDWSK